MSRKNNTGPYLLDGREVLGDTAVDIVHKIYTGESIRHWHDFYELEIICSGEGAYEVNGKTVKVSRGCAYLVTPEDYHKLTAENAEMYTVSFGVTSVDWDIIRKISESKSATVVRFSDGEFERIERVLALLLSEFSSNMPMRENALKVLLEYMLISFLRSLEIGKSESGQKSTAIMRAVAYIQHNFKRDLSLKEVAEKAAVSTNYLGVLFVKELGITFSRYLGLTRLKYASNLIKYVSYSLEDIAYASGFSSPSYFSGVFKKEFGCTPSQMRNRLVKDGTLDGVSESEQ